MSDDFNTDALNAAWSGTVTPYSQIKDSLGITADDAGQYDLAVSKLQPSNDKNGLYCIVGEFTVLAPTGFSFPYKRTLYVGTHKDKMAERPETRLNSPGLRFLKNIAKVNNVPTNDQSDAALAASIMGRSFGVRIEATEYTGADGTKKRGTDFGRNVTPAGLIPARLDRQAASATPTNGAANGQVTGAVFE